jgi:hypothetical protein
MGAALVEEVSSQRRSATAVALPSRVPSKMVLATDGKTSLAGDV